MHAGLKSKKIALFGLGEAGSLVAIDMQNAGLNITAYDPKHVATPCWRRSSTNTKRGRN